TMTRDLLLGADLVVCMAREHVREAVVVAREAWPRIFTLKELVRRGSAVGPRQPGQKVADWLLAAHDGRTTADLMGASAVDDVADPIGQHLSVYERMVAEVEDQVGKLVTLLWGPDVAGT
ncbi:MAG: hypothetical protein ACRDRT_19040, partial [Pseudonocardiaceae bacterium]